MVPALPRFAYVYSVLINFEQFLKSTSLAVFARRVQGNCSFPERGWNIVFCIRVQGNCSFRGPCGRIPGHLHDLLIYMWYSNVLMRFVFCIRVQRFWSFLADICIHFAQVGTRVRGFQWFLFILANCPELINHLAIEQWLIQKLIAQFSIAQLSNSFVQLFDSFRQCRRNC